MVPEPAGLWRFCSARSLLDIARLPADEHDPRPPRADPEYGLRGMSPEIAPLAAHRLQPDSRQALRHGPVPECLACGQTGLVNSIRQSGPPEKNGCSDFTKAGASPS